MSKMFDELDMIDDEFGSAGADIVEIECPNCGGIIKRKRSEYFGCCNYCGKEIVFDEIKEEVELDNIRKTVKHNLKKSEAKVKKYAEQYDRLKVFRKARNLYYILSGFLSYASWSCLKMRYNNAPDVVLIMFTVYITVICCGGGMLFKAYPTYDFIKDKEVVDAKAFIIPKIMLCQCLLNCLMYIFIFYFL